MENLTLKISSVLNFTLSDTNNEDDVLDHLMKKCCLWINRQSGSRNLGHRHFESISNNFIRLLPLRGVRETYLVSMSHLGILETVSSSDTFWA